MDYREEILTRVKALDLPEKEFIVVGSGPLAVCNLRAAADIDILITEPLFDELLRRGWEKRPWTKPWMVGRNWLKTEGVEAFDRMFLGERHDLQVKDLLPESDEIERIYFLKLEKLAEFKRNYGREKDFADVALIESYLKATGYKLPATS